MLFYSGFCIVRLCTVRTCVPGEIPASGNLVGVVAYVPYALDGWDVFKTSCFFTFPLRTRIFDEFDKYRACVPWAVPPTAPGGAEVILTRAVALSCRCRLKAPEDPKVPKVREDPRVPDPEEVEREEHPTKGSEGAASRQGEILDSTIRSAVWA